MLLCIGSYLLCKMTALRAISMGSFLIEMEVAEEEEVLGTGEVVSKAHGEDGVVAVILMTALVTSIGEVVVVTSIGEVVVVVVVEILELAATAGLEQEKAVGMIG